MPKWKKYTPERGRYLRYEKKYLQKKNIPRSSITFIETEWVFIMLVLFDIRLSFCN